MKIGFLHSSSTIKTIVDSAEYESALFREFGSQPDTDAAILELDEAFISYFTCESLHCANLLTIAPGIRVLHVAFEREGLPHELIVAFSESPNELFRHSLVVVPTRVAIAA